jgi:hypothetical protein
MTAVSIEPNVRALQERQEGSPPLADLFFQTILPVLVPISKIRKF